MTEPSKEMVETDDLEQRIATIIFEKTNRCKIRDPNSQWAENSRVIEAARAVIAVLIPAPPDLGWIQGDHETIRERRIGDIVNMCADVASDLQREIEQSGSEGSMPSNVLLIVEARIRSLARQKDAK